MIPVIALLLASVEGNSSRARANELRGRLGIQDEPKLNPVQSRIRWALGHLPRLPVDFVLASVSGWGLISDENDLTATVDAGKAINWLMRAFTDNLTSGRGPCIDMESLGMLRLSDYALDATGDPDILADYASADEFISSVQGWGVEFFDDVPGARLPASVEPLPSSSGRVLFFGIPSDDPIPRRSLNVSARSRLLSYTIPASTGTGIPSPSRRAPSDAVTFSVREPLLGWTMELRADLGGSSAGDTGAGRISVQVASPLAGEGVEMQLYRLVTTAGFVDAIGSLVYLLTTPGAIDSDPSSEFYEPPLSHRETSDSPTKGEIIASVLACADLLRRMRYEFYTTIGSLGSLIIGVVNYADRVTYDLSLDDMVDRIAALNFERTYDIVDLLKNPRDIAVSGRDYRTVVTFQDGSHIVEIMTAEGMRSEGFLADHCIGQEGQGHIKSLVLGRVRVFSYRSAKGKPLATLEVTNEPSSNAFATGYPTVDLQGPCNGPIHDADARERILALILTLRQVGIGEEPSLTADIGGIRASLYALSAADAQRLGVPVGRIGPATQQGRMTEALAAYLAGVLDRARSDAMSPWPERL